MGAGIGAAAEAAVRSDDLIAILSAIAAAGVAPWVTCYMARATGLSTDQALLALLVASIGVAFAQTALAYVYNPTYLSIVVVLGLPVMVLSALVAASWVAWHDRSR